MLSGCPYWGWVPPGAHIARTGAVVQQVVLVAVLSRWAGVESPAMVRGAQIDCVAVPPGMVVLGWCPGVPSW